MNSLIEEWKKSSNEKMKDSLSKLSPSELNDCFANDLEFGTAGIRGIMGPGISFFNEYTIIRYTFGFAKFIIEKYGKNSTVILGTDNRKNREYFLEIAANVLNSFGIKTFKKIVAPTPFISYTVRTMNAQGAIIITASHNPMEYNGYKLYDNLGCQLLPTDNEAIKNYSSEIDDIFAFEKTLKTDGLLNTTIPREVESSYLESVASILPTRTKSDLKIVFSAQNGTSGEMGLKLLRAKEFDVLPVESQINPDENFSGTKSPNPESMVAFEEGVRIAQENSADIIIANDPDADRVGVVAFDKGEYKLLSGNQTALITLEYLINHKDTKDKYICYSIVSTNLASIIANRNNLKHFVTSTGFKYIGNLIEREGADNYLFGFEESFGSLVDSRIARDKDGLQSVLLISEIASYYKDKGMTLFDALEEVYKKYGFVKDKVISIAFSGSNAQSEMNSLVNKMRSDKNNIEGFEIVDYEKGLMDVAPTNLLMLKKPNGSWIAVRPSGTEPKVKVYFEACATNQGDVENEMSLLMNAWEDLFKKYK